MKKEQIEKEQSEGKQNDKSLVEIYDNDLDIEITDEQKIVDGEMDETHIIKLPKNVRQIGIIDKKSRIYIEDYVVTYLKQNARERAEVFGAAALYGKITYIENIKYVFVIGAFYQDISAQNEIEEGPSEAVLNLCKNTNKEWFDDLAPVGIAVFHKSNMHIPVKWHQKGNLVRLVGRGEVFIDIQTDDEETQYSFIHDDGVEIKDGHFIFYDKNEKMQSFLVHWHEQDKIPDLEERDEIVSENCRIALEDKKENRKQNFSMFSSVATSALILFGMCMIGINIMNQNAADASSDSVYVSTASKNQAYKETEPTSYINTDDNKRVDDEIISIDTDGVNDNNLLSLDEFITNQSTAYIVSEEKNETNDNKEDSAGIQSESDEDKVADLTESKDCVAGDDVINVIDEIKYSQYKIQKGDTLYEICMRRYGTITYLNDICNRNNIEDQNSIYYGQIIELPEK